MGLIIGLTGFKGSGKSTVAKYLQENYGFTRVNFKDALIREMKLHMPNILKELSEFYSMNVDDLFDAKPPMMRALMLDFGTELRRKENENHWIDQYVAKAQTIKGNIVTDDVRFNNEYKTIKDHDHLMIRVKRDDITSGGDHQSETEQIGFSVDFVVEGEPGSHASIYKQIDSILEIAKRD